ncbi:hypothetical protein [Lactovum miscens]|uniref:Uncharacterized protein n=1 Tax=Lactovum miscens TaxID=190387 RepID=A0A841C1F6_9LACT|nr:hypothetical protein [Lactovum miscens]MBB5887746.1 hypothetical protein [Lactovum miscens]
MFEQDVIKNWNWTLKEVDDQDYYELMDVFNADANKKMASFTNIKEMFGQ